MRRSLVFALMLSLSHASVALAGRGPHDADFASWGGSGGGKETLLQSGKRLTRHVAETKQARSVQPALQAQTTLAQSGLRKRTKLLIAIGVAVAFGGVAYAIDRGVEDSTPSSLGQR